MHCDEICWIHLLLEDKPNFLAGCFSTPDFWTFYENFDHNTFNKLGETRLCNRANRNNVKFRIDFTNFVKHLKKHNIINTEHTEGETTDRLTWEARGKTSCYLANSVTTSPKTFLTIFSVFFPHFFNIFLFSWND